MIHLTRNFCRFNREFTVRFLLLTIVCRRHCSTCAVWYRRIIERRGDRDTTTAAGSGELPDDDDRPRGRRGGAAARLLLPPLSTELRISSL